jgi:hypothetical protein
MDSQASERDPNLDSVAPADEAQLPCTPSLPLRDRVQSRGLQTLKLEALQAIAALLLGHEIGVSVLGERCSEAVEAGASEDTCAELGLRTEEWAQDAALLRGVLAQVRAIGVPAEPVIRHLELAPQEWDDVQEVIGHVEAQVHRVLVEEQMKA